MNILNKILEVKKKEVMARKEMIPANVYMKVPEYKLERASFYNAIKNPYPSIIAEFKRKSPSRGIINPTANLYDIITGYTNAGVQAISVLTDYEFFQGSLSDLQDATLLSSLPTLRKDFILDEYQIFEAKAFGASAILLIASILNADEVKNLTRIASDCGMDVLFEIYDEKDLDKWFPEIKIIGINNRNLDSFTINPDHSLKLLNKLPGSCIKVVESGISDINTVIQLFKEGYEAFLIGEAFMKTIEPGTTARKFIKEIYYMMDTI